MCRTRDLQLKTQKLFPREKKKEAAGDQQEGWPPDSLRTPYHLATSREDHKLWLFAPLDTRGAKKTGVSKTNDRQCHDSNMRSSASKEAEAPQCHCFFVKNRSSLFAICCARIAGWYWKQRKQIFLGFFMQDGNGRTSDFSADALPLGHIDQVR